MSLNNDSMFPLVQTTDDHNVSDYVSEDAGSKKFGKGLSIKTSQYKSMFGCHPLAKYNSTESLGLGSFTMHSSPTPPAKVPVETLLNYLSENIDKITDDSPELKRLEEITNELLDVNQDVKIMRILKDNGWTGSRYKTSSDHHTINLQFLLQALSNYYLRVKKFKISSSLFNLLGPDADSRGLDKIVPFCPDMLLRYLRHNVFPPLKSGGLSSDSIDNVPCISFTGACMLVDISGFSKFSGAMCSKGVNGLDELRHATNGFLGYFVRIVYDFDGDVIAFAGDALICVFQDLDSQKKFNASSTTTSLPPRPSREDDATSHTRVSNCCYRAMQCAAILKNHEASSTMTSMSLSTHIGLSYGDMKMALLGGHNDQYVYVMNGQCVSALSSCVTDAQSKQVVVTRECLEYGLQHGEINYSEVENSSSTSGYPNNLIEDGDSLLKKAPESFHRQSFHERVGLIKKYSVYIADGANSPWSTVSKAETGSESSEIVMLHSKVNSTTLSASDGSTMTSSMKKTNGPKRAASITFNLKTGNEDTESESVMSAISPAVQSIASPALRYQSLENVNPSSRFYSNPQSSIYNFNFDRQSSEKSVISSGSTVHQSSFVENIAMFVPVVILAAACSGSMDTIGELRQVTTVFIELKSYDPVKHSDPRCLQPFFLMAQQCLQESGGFLRQFLVDDKGCVLIAMWGTPSFTYSNNSSRALFFAVSVNQKALELGHCCSAGVTTGTVFCGTVGANERCDYAGVGTDVNMAARLMCKAEGGVLVDRLTYQSLNHDIKELLTETYPMALKGSALPVTPFKYTSTSIPPMRAVEEYGGKSVFLKRKVMAIVSEMLDKHASSLFLKPHSSLGENDTLTPAREFTREMSNARGNIEVLVVTGATGTGKTVAANYCQHAAIKQGFQVIFLNANSSSSSIPYGIIRELFLELLPYGRKEGYKSDDHNFVHKLVRECYPFEDENHHNYVVKQIEILLGLTEEADSRNHHLLNQLSNNFSDSAVNFMIDDAQSTASFALTEPSVRGFDTTNMPSVSSIIYQVLVTLLANAPCTLIIENFHFCDELSWQEIMQIITHKDQVLTMTIMLTLRTAPVEVKSLNSSLDHMDITSKSASLSPVSNRTSMHYNFKGLSQAHLTPLSAANLNKSETPLKRPHSIIQMNSQNTFTDKIGTSLEESFKALMKLPVTTVHELTSLTSEEVKQVLVDVLGADNVTEDLVQLVADVSAGNIYWCKSIASFIKERDVDELKGLLTSSKGGTFSANPLKDLVLCRMERLSNDLILVLKHVSVIGHEFNEGLVFGIMTFSSKSKKTPVTLSEQLTTLERKGFIYLLEEHPVPIYGFQNELIRKTLYELLPPGDAAAIHCRIAQYMEKEFESDLRPFYPTIAFNYMNAGKALRHLAFKYQMKAANHSINHGAYGDGLVYTQAAEELVEKKVEYIVLIEVVQHAINDLIKLMPKTDYGVEPSLPPSPMAGSGHGEMNKEYSNRGLHLKSASQSPRVLSPIKQNSHLSNQFSRSFYCEHESDLKQKINAYQAIKSNCETTLTKLRAKDNLGPTKSEESNGSGKTKKKKDIRAMLMRKNTSRKLSWQLSTAIPRGNYGAEKASNEDETPQTVTGTEPSDSEGVGAGKQNSIDMSSKDTVSNKGCCIIM